MEPNRCRAGWLKKPGVLTGPAALGVNTVLANTEPDATENMNEQYELILAGRTVAYLHWLFTAFRGLFGPGNKQVL